MHVHLCIVFLRLKVHAHVLIPVHSMLHINGVFLSSLIAWEKHLCVLITNDSQLTPIVSFSRKTGYCFVVVIITSYQYVHVPFLLLV